MTNRIDYFEIGTPQPGQAREFYGGLFGWEIGPPSEPAQYAMVDGGNGGLWDTTGIGAESWAIFYVHVPDVAAAIAKAEELGARVAIPLTDNGQIEFAHLVDPLGNRFGVWRARRTLRQPSRTSSSAPSPSAPTRNGTPQSCRAR